MGLFKFIDSISDGLDKLMDKIENSIDQFGNFLDDKIGKKLVTNQQHISSTLSGQRSNIGKQVNDDVKTLISKGSQPDGVTKFVDSDFEKELMESLSYLGIQLPINTTDNTKIQTTNEDEDYDYDMLTEEDEYGEFIEEDEEDENQDFLNLILGG